jgi:hypothetical protein
MDQEKLKKLQAAAANNRIGKSSAVAFHGYFLRGTANIFVQGKQNSSTTHRVTIPRSAQELELGGKDRLLTECSGKGTPRRKTKKVHKSSGTDDKKLQTSLKKLNVQPIQAIEEVNMFKEDGNVIHFAAPKGTSIDLLAGIATLTCLLERSSFTHRSVL